LAFDDYSYNVWMTGGLDISKRNTPISDTYIIDIKNLTCNKFAVAAKGPNLINPRSLHSSIFLNNSIFIIGGKNNNSIEKIDLKTQSVTQLPYSI
jgi:hypothetical protein